jgi:succinyl-CoA synthetase beta subunit
MLATHLRPSDCRLLSGFCHPPHTGFLIMINTLRTGTRRVLPSFGVGAVQIPQQQSRNLNVHEYVGIKLLSERGVNTPKASTAKTAEEAKALVESGAFGDSDDVVVKCQVLAGGRGKGTFKNGFQGGVHIATR